MDCGNPCVAEVSCPVNLAFLVTVTSVPLYASLKISLKPRSIWSVSTYVPLIIATPRTMARVVRTVRSLCAVRLRHAIRIIARPPAT